MTLASSASSLQRHPPPRRDDLNHDHPPAGIPRPSRRPTEDHRMCSRAISSLSPTAAMIEARLMRAIGVTSSGGSSSRCSSPHTSAARDFMATCGGSSTPGSPTRIPAGSGASCRPSLARGPPLGGRSVAAPDPAVAPPARGCRAFRSSSTCRGECVSLRRRLGAATRPRRPSVPPRPPAGMPGGGAGKPR